MKLHKDVTHWRTIKGFNTLESRLNKIHNNKYNYDKFIYFNNSTKSIIICQVHGEFLQESSAHLTGKGCKECGINEMRSKQSKTLKQFIENAILIHGTTYDYSRVVYKNSHTKLIITCPIHGDFEQTPASHLSGSGCMECGGRKQHTSESFTAKANGIHDDLYGYSNVDYKNVETEVVITCKIHGNFKQRPDDHLYNKAGCPYCGEIIIQTKKTARLTCLYYIKLSDKNDNILGYKIGISVNLKERFSPETNAGIKYEIIHITEPMDRKSAVTLEQEILSIYRDSLLNPQSPILHKGSGDNEIFELNIEHMIDHYFLP